MGGCATTIPTVRLPPFTANQTCKGRNNGLPSTQSVLKAHCSRERLYTCLLCHAINSTFFAIRRFKIPTIDAFMFWCECFLKRWNGRVKFKAKCNYSSLSLQPQEVCMKVLVVQVFRVTLLVFAISQLTASRSRTQVLLLRRCLRLITSSASGQTTFGACIMYADLFSSSRWPAFSLRHDCSIAFRWIHPARLLYIERTCFVELWYYLYNC